MKRIALILTVALLCSCSGWTSAERKLIKADGETMRVLTVDNREDSLVLRTPSTGLDGKMMKSDLLGELSRKMLATVTSPEQDGVGIAGPQVGVNRRIVAVQRFDKEGEPFEVYPNIEIIELRGSLVKGPEGCLSVPDMRGDVMRYSEVVIRYTSSTDLTVKTEVVQGYTAVIFQHEVDHLKGVLYTDRLVTDKL